MFVNNLQLQLELIDRLPHGAAAHKSHRRGEKNVNRNTVVTVGYVDLQ